MCLILFAVAAHPHYPLVIAANRDEYYARPTRPLQAWPEAPQLFAGKDLEAGGTWLGITRSGRFAAITNVREGAPREPWQRSRGELTHDFLLGSGSAEAFGEFAYAQGEHYAGFNLLLGDLSRGDGLHYCSNRGISPQRIAPGVYGLSNDRLDTPWPKVETGKRALRELLRHTPTPAALLDILSDRTQPADSTLPTFSAGNVELERVYASRFIASPLYGTRASTALLIDNGGHVQLWEQNFDSGGRIGSLLKFDWPLQSGDASA